jgi:hypothetical protein
MRLPDTRLAAMALIAMLTGVNTWFREGGRLSRDQVEDIYVDMVRNRGRGAVHRPRICDWKEAQPRPVNGRFQTRPGLWGARHLRHGKGSAWHENRLHRSGQCRRQAVGQPDPQR